MHLRWGALDPAEADRHAAEPLALQPNVVLASPTPPALAIARRTKTIPIVFANVTDPIASGLVASFARPGGNITGFVNFQPSLAEKWMELLKELVPATRRVAILFNPDTAALNGGVLLGMFEGAAAAFGVEPAPEPVRGPPEIEAAIVRIAARPSGALAVLPSVFTSAHGQLITNLAAKARLPAVYGFRYLAMRGGLVSYGNDTHDLFRRAAGYVDRILRGVNPAELPVQQPTKFELVINLRTAREMRLDIPATLVARADEVIE